MAHIKANARRSGRIDCIDLPSIINLMHVKK
jgi:hypothetical protein